MSNEQINDLKQFFLGAIAQATAGLATKEDLVNLKSAMTTHMDKRFDEVLGAIGDTFTDYISYADDHFNKLESSLKRRPNATTA